MSEAELVGITGRELCAVRERAGWSRPRLAHLMRTEFEGDPHTVASIQRYEALDEVPAVFAKRVRDAIGAEIFDRLLELLRAGEAPMRRRAGRCETPRTEPSGGAPRTARAALIPSNTCACRRLKPFADCRTQPRDGSRSSRSPPSMTKRFP